MVGNRDFQRAVEDGRRNQEVKVLIQNWCGYARIEKFGGTGMIEKMTGFPIGNHSMGCDHAPPARMATWLLEDAALDFYDHNCVGCKLRHPLRLPNLVQVVLERDRKKAEWEADKTRTAKALNDAFDSRQRIRDELRLDATAPVAALIEDIQLLDQKRTQDAAEKILATASLAPEVFTGALVEHLFNLVEASESWASDTALRCLNLLSADYDRLVACAMHRISSGSDLAIAGEILVSHLNLVKEGQVGAAVKSLCFYAAPPRNQFDFSEPERHPEPLQALAVMFAKPVEKALDTLIGSRVAKDVSVAARVMHLLYVDVTFPVGLVRGLAAKLARIDILLDSDRDSEIDGIAQDLSRALVSAFQADDQQVDTLLANYYASASSIGEARIAGVYSDLLRLPQSRFDSEEPILNLKPYGTALRRILQWASVSQNTEVLKEVHEALRHFPDQLAPVVSEQIEFLLGTAALVDQALQNLMDSKVAPEDANNLLAHLERDSRIQQVAGLRAAILEWVSSAAAVNSIAADNFISFINSDVPWPEQFRSALVKALPPLMKTGASVNAVLPYLYGALVGESALVRMAGARALQDLRSSRVKDLPSLVHDAFLLLLADPIKGVHQSAVNTLARISLPEEYGRQINLRLLNIFEAYSQSIGEDAEFLVTCVDLLVSRLHEDVSALAKWGPIFVAVLLNLDAATVLRRSHLWMLKRLIHIEGFPDLLLRLLQYAREVEHHDEELVTLLRELPESGVQIIQDKLANFCQDLAFGRVLGAACIEVLTAADAWDTAVEVANQSHQSLGDSVQMKVRKQYAELTLLGTKLEQHLAKGAVPEALECSDKWHGVLREIQKSRGTE